MRQTHLKWLLLALAIVVLVPTTIVITSIALGVANESVGWLRYRLPGAFFWIFLGTGLASPFMGIGTLLLLWRHRHKGGVMTGSAVDRRLEIVLILASLAALFAPVAWGFVFSEVFFAAGGNR